MIPRGAVILLSGCALIGACRGEGTHGPTVPAEVIESLPVLTSMTVTVATAPIEVGQSASAHLVAIDQRGRAMTVGVTAWVTTNPTVATISADGIITARAPGQTLVTARVGTVQAQTEVMVKPLPPGPAPVASLTVTPLSASLVVAQSLRAEAIARDYAGNALVDRDMQWTTSDPHVATVSPQGLITALESGVAIIEVTSEMRRAAVAIAVTAATDTEIVVTVPVPAPQTIVGDSIDVVATVQSLYGVVSVEASAGGQISSMRYGPISGTGPKGTGEPPMGWSVTVDLSTLPFGAYAMVVTAIDSRGHRGVRAVPFVRNPRVPGGSKTPPGNK
jgi:hypothetical protein